MLIQETTYLGRLGQLFVPFPAWGDSRTVDSSEQRSLWNDLEGRLACSLETFNIGNIDFEVVRSLLVV